MIAPLGYNPNYTTMGVPFNVLDLTSKKTHTRMGCEFCNKWAGVENRGDKGTACYNQQIQENAEGALLFK